MAVREELNLKHNTFVNNLSTPTPDQQPSKMRGFTLIELMVTLSVAAVLAALAAPSFQGMIASGRINSGTNDLMGTLAVARSEAIRRNTRITVCKSANQSACTTSGTWDQGWIVFVDTTRATNASVDTGETILSVAQKVAGNTVINGSSGVANYVSFASDGRAKAMDGTALSGTLRVCSPSSALSDAKRARDITLLPVGRATWSSTAGGVANTCPSPT
jgi:type IV fimbrial biogenesis protein FimT